MSTPKKEYTCGRCKDTGVDPTHNDEPCRMCGRSIADVMRTLLRSLAQKGKIVC